MMIEPLALDFEMAGKSPLSGPEPPTEKSMLVQPDQASDNKPVTREQATPLANEASNDAQHEACQQASAKSDVGGSLKTLPYTPDQEKAMSDPHKLQQVACYKYQAGCSIRSDHVI